jgi:hypothetical protein
MLENRCQLIAYTMPNRVKSRILHCVHRIRSAGTYFMICQSVSEHLIIFHCIYAITLPLIVGTAPALSINLESVCRKHLDSKWAAHILADGP